MVRRNLFICLLLAGVTLGIYWPTHHYDLVNFDDPEVLHGSPALESGFTLAGLKWVMTSVVVANWHPLTNLSFLVVSQFFGNTPEANHVLNASLHAINTALLFLLMIRLTRAPWRSAVLAAIFAWHPLRVESVAWISERKDVLFAGFFFLSLLAYTRFIEKRTGDPRPAWRTKWSNLSLLMFALSLLSKPMAVTLPFVLLLLDFWPLNRMPSLDDKKAWFKSLAALGLEKWPFLMATMLFSVVTYHVQHGSGTLMPLAVLGPDARLANIISGYIGYLGKLFWPMNLAVIYLLPIQYDLGVTSLKAALLLVITIGCLNQIRRRPWLAMGWFWYLGTALPIIGLVQVGEQSMADRYTYLPLIGPVMALVWWAREIVSESRRQQTILAGITIILLSVLAVLSAQQVQHWRNTITLFEHTVAITPPNPPAMCSLGSGYETAGETNLAITAYRVTEMMTPHDPVSTRGLAKLLVRKGYPVAAEASYTEYLFYNPNDFSAHLDLANILALEGRRNEYVSELNEVIRINPDCIEALNNLAWELAANPNAAVRDGTRAVVLAQHACELTRFKQTIYIGTLAAAYAEAGRLGEAIATAQRACDLAQQNKESDLIERNQALLERYKQHKTAHD